ncbi:hypothetical protein D3C71_2080820 [compost metagenome]
MLTISRATASNLSTRMTGIFAAVSRASARVFWPPKYACGSSIMGSAYAALRAGKAPISFKECSWISLLTVMNLMNSHACALLAAFFGMP